MKVLINSGLIIPVFKKRDKLIKKIKENNDVTISGYEKNVEEICSSYGVKCQYIPMSRAGLNPLKDIKTLISYYKLVKKEKYDIVHSYTAKPNIYGSIGARLAGCKKVYPTINGLGYAFTGSGFKNKIIRMITCFLYKIAFACSNKVFFQNINDANELVKKRILKKDKCVIISGSGVDTKLYDFAKLNSSNVFFLASRLLVTKGLREYFKAAEIIKKKYPDCQFLLAGSLDPNPDGITKEELDYYTEKGYVQYLGVLDNIISELQRCSVFVLPSYYREGVPHAILEAMSIGRAIITTDSPGCRETINNKNGLLVKPKDYEDLADKMLWMVEHKKEVEQMGLESRKYVLERFDVDIVNKDILRTLGL